MRQEHMEEVVRARRFELLDKKGKVRAAMEIQADLTGIVLVGADGKHRVGLWLNDDGRPSIGLKDADGRMAFMLTLGHGETRLLTMADKEGHVRLALSLTPDGQAEVHLTSEDGQRRRITATSSEAMEPSQAEVEFREPEASVAEPPARQQPKARAEEPPEHQEPKEEAA